MNTVIQVLTPQSMVFDVQGITVATANALRRILMSHVPTLAMRDVLITTNSTAFHDEFVCHRVGLVPLRHTSDPQLRSFNFEGIDCSCASRCPRCEASLEIKCRADGEACFHMTSRNLKCSNPAIVPVHFLDSEEEEKAKMAEKVLYPNRQTTQTGIRIAPVKEGQEFVGVGKIVKGRGVDHPRWSPVANCGVTQLEPGTQKIWMDPKGVERGRTFRFNVELVGQLTGQEVLQSAFRVMREKCKVLHKACY